MIRVFGGLTAACVAAMLFHATDAFAQEKELSVKYLRAAIGSIADQTPVTIEAEFVAERGLTQAEGRYMRGKGFSRFSIRDPDSDFTFDSMYCSADSQAFRDLLKAKGRSVFRFEGQKRQAEYREDAVFVTRVQQIASPAQTPSIGSAASPSYRVTLVDNVTSNRTVLVNVRPGQTYDAGKVKVMVERE